MAPSKKQAIQQLTKLGLSKSTANLAYFTLGPSATEMVLNNPYILLQVNEKPVWQEADQIALKMGFDEFSQERLAGAILYALQGSTSDGHVFLPQQELYHRALRVLDLNEPSLLESTLTNLEKSKKIIVKENGTVNTVYLESLHRAEKEIAVFLKSIDESSSRLVLRPPTGEEMEQVEKELEITFAPAQREAIIASLENKIVIITGGPGTGKTTIIRGVLQLWEKKGTHILLAAPTGRAAKRMRESTGRKASTIHRLLEYNPDTRAFNRNRHRKLKADLMVVDEASMIDTELMASLLEALPPHCHLLFVGDTDQLPAVGPGYVLHDLIACGYFKTIRLHEIYRQERGSLISLNAQMINEGRLPETEGEGIELGQDFFFISRKDAEGTCAAVVEMVSERIPRQFGLNPKEDVQVLCTMNKREAGVEPMNILLQENLNPDHPRVKSPFYALSVGDKIMQIKNDYNKDVFNGDIGYVTYISSKDRIVLALFDGASKTYSWDELTNTTLAYAVTVHKSQGSEYPAVVLPLLTQHHPMLQRNLLYTAVSRGKRLVVIIGQKRALELAVQNNRIRRRYTGLCELLKELYEKPANRLKHRSDRKESESGCSA